MPAETSPQLFAYALRLLGRRWYSIAEMKKKLQTRQQKWKVGNAEDIDPIIEQLKKLKYLDDRNFARLYIESTLRQKPQGKKMLELKLKQKGVASNLASQTLEQQKLDEFELATLAAQKKLRTLSEPDSLKKKAKIYRFLLARGFSHSVSMKVLGHISKPIYNSISP